MSEWLGRSRITKEDIEKDMPSMVEFFPMLTNFYVDDQKMRIVLPLPYNTGDEFKEKVTKTYGDFTPTNVRKAVSEAIDHWIKSH